ncbi:hypothetical protein BLAT2472_50103 [Burkholderia latens]
MRCEFHDSARGSCSVVRRSGSEKNSAAEAAKQSGRALIAACRDADTRRQGLCEWHRPACVTDVDATVRRGNARPSRAALTVGVNVRAFA